jgi:hypothetical protein
LSRLNTEQIQAIHQLLESDIVRSSDGLPQSNIKTRQIRTMLEDRFGLVTARDLTRLSYNKPRLDFDTVITESIIKNEVNKWKRKDEPKREKDATVVWQNFTTLERMGIRVDMLPKLRGFQREIQLRYPQIVGTQPEPSYRELIWQQYVLSYCPELDTEDILYLAELYHQESFIADYNDRTPDYALLEEMLTLKPWESFDACKTFFTKHQLEVFNILGKYLDIDDDSVSYEFTSRTFFGRVLAHAQVAEYSPWILPSQLPSTVDLWRWISINDVEGLGNALLREFDKLQRDALIGSYPTIFAGLRELRDEIPTLSQDVKKHLRTLALGIEEFYGEQVQSTVLREITWTRVEPQMRGSEDNE